MRGPRGRPLERHDRASESSTTPGEVIVDAEFGLVLWDPNARSSRPLTEAERASLDVTEAVDRGD